MTDLAINHDLKIIENKILPNNCNFSEEQRKVILFNNSANVVAGPGSGKTTVLIAKIVLTLSEMKRQGNFSEKGICIITHTNVAVDEIKEQLNCIGIESIDYPHFIGTIHDFFNHFFTYAAFNELFNSENVTFYDDEVYREHFGMVFSDYKPDGYRGYPPTSTISKTYLDITNNKVTDIIGDIPPFYRKELLETYKALISKGILRHNDTLSLSKWYIEKYSKQIRKAIENRFSWFFLDETQDASNFQYELLNKVFRNTECKMQKYGDPYQSLYNMFGEDNDAWQPFNEPEGYIELSQSTRFGETIAKVLRTTCIEEYPTLKGNANINSYKPHLIFYNSKEDVISTFLNLVNDYAKEDKDFRKSTKKVGVVGLLHEEVSKYYKNYKKATEVKANTETLIKSYFEIVTKGLLYFIKYTDSESNYSIKKIKSMLNDETNILFKSEIANIIKVIMDNNGNMRDEDKTKIKSVFLWFIEKENLKARDEEPFLKVISLMENYFIKTYSSYKSNSKAVLNKKQNTDSYKIDDIKFGTVHSVKGETHKATLLLESKVVKNRFSDNPEVYYDCNMIFDFLMGDSYDYSKEKYTKYSVIKDALKTGFVALSRPTHLAVVALNKSNFADQYEDNKKRALQAGWEVIEID